jgi:hypothetical protein
MEALSVSYQSQVIGFGALKDKVEMHEALMYVQDMAVKCWHIAFKNSAIHNQKEDFLQCLSYGYWCAVLHNRDSTAIIQNL